MSEPSPSGSSAEPQTAPNSRLLIAGFLLGLTLLVLFLVMGVWNLQLLRERDSMLETLREAQELADDLPGEALETARVEMMREYIEAAEDRALGYLGIFEALGIVVAFVGGLITVLGLAAAFLVGRDYRQLRSEVERSKKDLDRITETTKQQSAEVIQSVKKSEEELKNIKEEAKSEIRDDLDGLKADLSQEVQNATLAQSLLPLAAQQYASNDIHGALATYDDALALDPTNPIPHYHRGYILTQMNDFVEAERALKTALELKEKFPQAQAALGFVYRRMGEEIEAALEREEYFHSAERMLEGALSTNPRLVDDDGESWWGVLGGLYRRRYEKTPLPEYLGKAIEHYQEAASVTPQTSYPVMNLALLSLEGQDRDATLRYFERVRDLSYRKVRAEVENYWAQGDLLMARLALGCCTPDNCRDSHNDRDDNAQIALDIFLEMLPSDVKDVLPRLRDSIQKIKAAPVLEGIRCDDAFIDHVLERLQDPAPKQA